MMYSVLALLLTGLSVVSSQTLIESVSSWWPYYGSWRFTDTASEDAFIATAHQYDLVVLHPDFGPRNLQDASRIVSEIQRGLDNEADTGDDVLVFGYVSIGEDERDPVEGDGRGPCFWDENLHQIGYQYLGVAGYYIDLFPFDGEIETHATWKGAFVNAGDPAWIEYVIGADQTLAATAADESEAVEPLMSSVLINGFGVDGLFLDTPETPNPWGGKGWTSEGMHALIKALDETFVESYMLLNRGLFYFSPLFPEQFKWNPRKHIDIALFESYAWDSDYADSAFNKSPFLNDNRWILQAHAEVENSRPDSTNLFVNIDYCNDPDNIFSDYPTEANWAWDLSLEFGKLQSFTDKYLTKTAVLPAPPVDESPPHWIATNRGYRWLAVDAPDFMAQGAMDPTASNPPDPRVGVQKAVPVDSGSVQVMWDLAVDQTRPVRYTIYASPDSPIDFNSPSIEIPNVAHEMPDEYADATTRSLTELDDVCPYAYTVTGLDSGRTYYFAVRASDSATSPHQEDNTFQLSAAWTDAGSSITVDGDPSDWTAVPSHAGDTDELAAMSAADTDDDVFVSLTSVTGFAGNGNPASYSLYLNVDALSQTGSTADEAKGCEYKIRGDGTVSEWDGTTWVSSSTVVTTVYSADSTFVELVIPKSLNANLMREDGLLGLTVSLDSDPVNYRIPASLAVSLDYRGLDPYSPDITASYDQMVQLHYRMAGYPLDEEGPVVDGSTFTAVDANTNGAVDLHWERASDANPPITYYVYLSSNGSPLTLITTTDDDTIRLADLDNDVEYTIALSAQDKLGQETGYGSRFVTPTRDISAPQWLGNPGISQIERGANEQTVRVIWKAAVDNSPPPGYFLFWSDKDDVLANDIDIPAEIDESSGAAKAIGPTPYGKITEGQWAGESYMYYYDLRLPDGIDRETTSFILRTRDRYGNEDNNEVVKRFTCRLPCGRNAVEDNDGCDTDGNCVCQDEILGTHCNYGYAPEVGKVQDDSFESGAASYWTGTGWSPGWWVPAWFNPEPAVWDDTNSHSGGWSLKVAATAAGGGGVYQMVEYLDEDDQPAQLRVKALCKAVGVTGTEDNFFGIYIDATLRSGDWMYGITAPCSTGTHDWEEISTMVSASTENPIARMYVYVWLRSVPSGPHAGTAFFDDVAIERFPTLLVNDLSSGEASSHSSDEEDLQFHAPVAAASDDEVTMVQVSGSRAGYSVYLRWGNLPDHAASIYDHVVHSTDSADVGIALKSQTGGLYFVVVLNDIPDIHVVVSAEWLSPVDVSGLASPLHQYTLPKGLKRVYEVTVAAGDQLDLAGEQIPDIYFNNGASPHCLEEGDASCSNSVTHIARQAKTVSIFPSSSAATYRIKSGPVSFLRLQFGEGGTYLMTVHAPTETTDVSMRIRQKDSALLTVTTASSEFAVLDVSDPHATTNACEVSDVLPSGWTEQASNSDAEAVAAAVSFPWGCECIVFDDGSAVATSGNEGTDCTSLPSTCDSGSGPTFRHLVRRDNGEADSPDFLGDESESPRFVEHFGGRTYASLDHELPVASSSPTCQSHAKRLPAGWDVASADDSFKAMAVGTGITFGSECLVMADGEAVGAVDPTGAGACAGNEDGNIRELIADSGIFHVSTCAHANQRIVIVRNTFPTETPRPSVASVNPTNVVHHEGKQYAVLANAPTSDSGCQTSSLALPNNWKIASTADWSGFSAPPVDGLWSPCLVLEGGDLLGSSCTLAAGPSVLQSVTVSSIEVITYHSPLACDAHILISSDSSTNNLEPQCFDHADGSLTLLEPLDNDSPTLEVYDYALLEIAPPADSGMTCGAYQVRQVPGWEHAPDTDATRRDLTCLDRRADCAILSNGASRSPMGECLFQSSHGLSMVEQDDGDSCFSLQVCPAKLLLRRRKTLEFGPVDPSFENYLQFWYPLGTTGLSLSGDGQSGSAITISNPGSQGGICQGIYPVGEQADAFRVRVATKTGPEGVGGNADSNYAIYADVRLEDGTVSWANTKAFPTGTHESWSTQALDLSFGGKKMVFLTLCLTFRDHTGTAYFDDVEIDFIEYAIPEGFVKNPSAFAGVAFWHNLGSAVEYDPDQNASPFGDSIKIVNTVGDNWKGYGQSIGGDVLEVGRPVNCIASSMSENAVTLTWAGDYSLYIDVIYADGGPHDYALGAHFNQAGVPDLEWETVSAVVTPTREVAYFNVWVLFRGHTGTAWFDDIQCYYDVDDSCPVTPVLSGSVYGFGHVFTLDQVPYDLTSTGTFWVFQSTMLEVQASVEEVAPGTLIVKEVAIRYDGGDAIIARVGEDPSDPLFTEPTMSVNGAPFAGGSFGDTGNCRVTGFMANTRFVEYLFTWTDTEYSMELSARYSEGVEGSATPFQYMQVVVHMPQPDASSGLLGNSNLEQSDEFDPMGNAADFGVAQLVTEESAMIALVEPAPSQLAEQVDLAVSPQALELCAGVAEGALKDACVYDLSVSSDVDGTLDGFAVTMTSVVESDEVTDVTGATPPSESGGSGDGGGDGPPVLVFIAGGVGAVVLIAGIGYGARRKMQSKTFGRSESTRSESSRANIIVDVADSTTQMAWSPVNTIRRSASSAEHNGPTGHFPDPAEFLKVQRTTKKSVSAPVSPVASPPSSPAWGVGKLARVQSIEVAIESDSDDSDSDPAQLRSEGNIAVTQSPFWSRSRGTSRVSSPVTEEDWDMPVGPSVTAIDSPPRRSHR